MKHGSYRNHLRRFDYFLRYGVRRPYIRGVALNCHFPIHEIDWLARKEGIPL